MDGMGWYISGCGIAIHNIKIQIRQGTMTRAHTYDTLVHFQPHIKPLMCTGVNLCKVQNYAKCKIIQGAKSCKVQNYAKEKIMQSAKLCKGKNYARYKIMQGAKLCKV